MVEHLKHKGTSHSSSGLCEDGQHRFLGRLVTHRLGLCFPSFVLSEDLGPYS